MIWFLLWLMINKFLNCSVTMINQLFNKFNNLFVFDPNKKSRKLLTLWKIPTHSLKVLNCTKKTPLNFSSNSNNSGVVTHTHRLQKAGIVSEAWRQVGGTGEDRVSGSDRQLSIKSSWADNAVRVRVLIKMSPAQTVTRAGGTVAELSLVTKMQMFTLQYGF